MSGPVLNPPILGALTLGDAEEQALLAVLRRGELFRHFDGRSECEALEAELGARMGGEALVLSSGTAALRAGLHALGVQAGDRVLVSAWTFVASASAVLSLGAVPVAVDVGPDLGVDVEDFERKGVDARAAVLTYLPGQASNIHLLPPLCPILEDACQALGVRAGVAWAGCSATVGVTSFQQGKQLCAGEGGALFSTSTDLVSAARRFSDHGAVRDGLPDWEDPRADIGENLRASELTAAILRPQLRRLDAMLESQRALARALRELLLARGAPVLRSRAPEEDSGSHVLLLAPSEARAQAWTADLAALGVHLRTVWPTCWMDLGSLRRRGLQPPEGDCPRARDWAPRTRAMTVPPLSEAAGEHFLRAVSEHRAWD